MGKRERYHSQKSRLAERHAALSAYDDVIEQAHADGLGRRGEAARELPVFARGGRVAGGMVVIQDHPGRLAEQRAPQDLAGLDDRAVERAAVDLRVVLQKPVSRVEKQRARALLRIVGLRLAQELHHEARLVEEVTSGERLGRKAARDL